MSFDEIEAPKQLNRLSATTGRNVYGECTANVWRAFRRDVAFERAYKLLADRQPKFRAVVRAGSQ